MSIVADLMLKPGVLAAGEYAFRGDRFGWKGPLSEEQARMTTIMCRATTMEVSMESRMAAEIHAGFPLRQPHGWLTRGPDCTLCVIANVFCLVRNEPGAVDTVIGLMRERLADADMSLV